MIQEGSNLINYKENFKPFQNIESQTIERFFQQYLTSKGDKEYRMVVLGVWTVYLKDGAALHLVPIQVPMPPQKRQF